MPAIELFLPLPPTTNNLYVNAGKRGRIKSAAYEAWITEAGHTPLAGEWKRLAEQPGNGIPWVLNLTVHGLPKNADLTNRIKAVEDLLCAMTGLEDCNTRLVEARKEPAHATLGRCVKVWAVTLSIVD